LASNAPILSGNRSARLCLAIPTIPLRGTSQVGAAFGAAFGCGILALSKAEGNSALRCYRATLASNAPILSGNRSARLCLAIPTIPLRGTSQVGAAFGCGILALSKAEGNSALRCYRATLASNAPILSGNRSARLCLAIPTIPLRGTSQVGATFGAAFGCGINSALRFSFVTFVVKGFSLPVCPG